MEKQLCSYCQREYGTISINNLPIFKTHDHIKPRNSSKNDKKRWKGINSKYITIKQLNELLECCNECNNCKSNLTLKDFSRRLSEIKKTKRGQYLNKDLIIIIRNSIRVLNENKLNPFVLNSTLLIE